MNTGSESAPAGVVGKVLAVVCMAGFWVLPVSPLVAIGAVVATRRSAGWPRTLAKTGAVLSIVCTGMAAAVFLWLLVIVWMRGGDFAF
jgi:Na+/H+-dicarboxylate symporter